MRAASRVKAKKVDTYAVALRNLGANADVFVAGDKQGIGDGPITGEFYKIGNDEGVDPLLFTPPIQNTGTAKLLC